MTPNHPHLYQALAMVLAVALLLPPGAATAEPLSSRDLSPIQDPLLQRQLVELVEGHGWSNLADMGRLEITLVLLQDKGYRLAGINGRHMAYAASLPKIAILFAVMVAAQEDDLTIDKALDRDLHDMIRKSCNPCANRAMDRVGRDEMLAILQRPEYGFYDNDLYGGLWVGKDYSAGSAYRRDPLKGLSHAATTFQVARLYYGLETGWLLNREYTKRMLGYMDKPGISHKFVYALQNEEDINMWRKSGTWKNYHADSVMVDSRDGRYILVGMVEGADGENILRTLARDVHKLVAAQRST